jgi:hypothetical protein
MTPLLFEENVTQFELDMGDVIGKVSTAQTETCPIKTLPQRLCPTYQQTPFGGSNFALSKAVAFCRTQNNARSESFFRSSRRMFVY